jgi:hypothetical protein
MEGIDVIGVEIVRQAFQEKLAKTGSFDAAFTKAVWTSFLAGYAAGIEAQKAGNEEKQQELE